MISKLKLENFEAHKSTVLEFDAGVNVIIGESDHGKSSLVKALDCAIRNNIDDAYIRDGQKEFKVTVDDVERVRSTNKNEYYLKGDLLRAFGTEPPTEVIQYFDMDSYLNWQGQFDSAFLLTDTGGEVARKLNKLVDLDIIITSQKRINFDVSQIKREQKFNEDELIKSQEKLSHYDYLEELSKVGERYDFLLNKEVEIIIQFNKLTALKANFITNKKRLDKLKKIVVLSQIYDIIISIVKEQKEVENKMNTITELRSKIKQVDDRIKERSKMIEMRESINTIDSNCGKCVELKATIQDLKYFQIGLLTQKENITKYQADMIRIEGMIPETCPTCGNILLEKEGLK